MWTNAQFKIISFERIYAKLKGKLVLFYNFRKLLYFKSDFHLRADENQPFFSTLLPRKSILTLLLSEKAYTFTSH